MWNQQREALVAFVGARYDEDAVEALARDEWPLKGNLFIGYEDEGGTARHGDYGTGRALRDVESKRRILAEVVEQIDDMDARIEGEWGSGGNHTTGESDLLLTLLALPYSDHPDYDPEWAPTKPAR